VTDIKGELGGRRIHTETFLVFMLIFDLIEIQMYTVSLNLKSSVYTADHLLLTN